MKSSLRSFDEQGRMIRTGRSVRGRRGIVCAGRAEAAAIGAKVLSEGGNAVDAAVATAFALGVCEPNASGLGGGGFMLVYNACSGKSTFLNFREKSPLAAEPSMYSPKAPGSNEDVQLRNIYSGLAAAVPGEVAGLAYAQERFGSLSLADTIAPAAALARSGFEVSPLLSSDIREHQKQLVQYGDGCRIYLPDGQVPLPGSILRNPDLADTLDLIAKEGPEVFYLGDIAQRILRAIQKDGGRLSARDLSEYRPVELSPVRGNYRGYEILSSPPPSSGGTHVVQILNVLEQFDVGSLEVNSAAYIHLFSEVFKKCYADRAAYMGDPAFADVPLEGLLSKAYAKDIASRIDLNHAQIPACGVPQRYESVSTTHFSAADSEGNLAAVTRTINHFFGSCVVPEGCGFLLNDEMEDFSLDPASPNAVAGGKVPLSCMSPTIILKDGKPVAVLGSPGGIRIISSVVQVISKLIDHGMSLEEAVNSPRFGDDAKDCIIYESRISEDTIAKLEAMGHRTRKYEDWDRIMGAVNSVQILDDGFYGAADPRRDGFAIGV